MKCSRRYTYPFLESIKVVDGSTPHLFWHQQRINQTFDHFYPSYRKLDLSTVVEATDLPLTGIYKWRIVYDHSSYEMELQSYSVRTFSKVHLVDLPLGLDYRFKYCWRQKINQLVQPDLEVIMIRDDGRLTDSSIANIVLWDGDRWVTPNTYLLNGTARQRLLAEGRIIELPVSKNALQNYQKIGFINAIMDLGECTYDYSSLAIS